MPHLPRTPRKVLAELSAETAPDNSLTSNISSLVGAIILGPTASVEEHIHLMEERQDGVQNLLGDLETTRAPDVAVALGGLR